MDSVDLVALERRARLRYELGRAVRSVLGFAPALLIVGVAAFFSRRPGSALFFGGLLFVSGALLLWRGKTVHRAVLPGLLAGLIPLALSLVANRGHVCLSGHCSTWCLPACVAGGVTAGLLISWLAARKGMDWSFWAGASVVSLLTGAMGCACVGYSGVVGLGIGFVVATAPWVVRRLVRPSA